MKLPTLFVPDKDLEDEVERLLKKEARCTNVRRDYGEFEVILAGTFAEGIAQLKKRGQKPFTFAENIEARITDYELNGEDSKLFDTWLDSVTGIAYKARSTKFKLILRSDRLENIPQDFNQSFIPIDYVKVQGIELDSKKGKYNKALTREEVKDHELWIAVMNNDREKLARYVDFWFDKTDRKEGMGVYLRGSTRRDELRVLDLSNDGDSDALGGGDLDDGARFVSGAQ